MTSRLQTTIANGATGAPELLLVGASFRTASLPLRDALSFRADQTTELLQAAAAESVVSEAAVLSTCNRTEFYLVSDHPEAPRMWRAWLARWRPAGILDELATHGYVHRGEAAVAHLLRVATGLDSAVLGDVQIQGQVKAAHQAAARAGSLGDLLQEAFARALRTGRRARAETAIARGRPTIGSALAGLLEQCLAHRPEEQPTIVILGAGKVARTVGGQLAKRGFGRLVFVNRTPATGDLVAARCGGEARTWDALADALAVADAVVAATAADRPILTRSMLEQAAVGRERRPLVIDAGVPRNVEPCDAVDLWDIDAVREHQERDLAIRQAAIPEVERIVSQELEQWRAWLRRRPLEGLIGSLYREAANLSRREARRLHPLPEAEAERALYTAFKHLLHDHVRRLRGLHRPPSAWDVEPESG